jgi:hypothetical protein
MQMQETEIFFFTQVLYVWTIGTPHPLDCKSFPLRQVSIKPRFCLRHVSVYLFYYDLFNDVVSTLDYTEANTTFEHS